MRIKYGQAVFYNLKYRDMEAIVCPICKNDNIYAEYRKLVKEVLLYFINAVLKERSQPGSH